MKAPIFYLFLFLFCSLKTNSQTIGRASISAFGSSNSNNGILIHQTVGQSGLVTYETKGDGFYLRQGFNQPLSLKLKNNDLSIELFPNPNNGQFFFKLLNSFSESFDYSLYDMAGKLIFNGHAYSDQLVQVNVGKICRGVYHLQIVQEQLTASFKVIIVE
jgi:hypothetical protein